MAFDGSMWGTDVPYSLWHALVLNCDCHCSLREQSHSCGVCVSRSCFHCFLVWALLIMKWRGSWVLLCGVFCGFWDRSSLMCNEEIHVFLSFFFYLFALSVSGYLKCNLLLPCLSLISDNVCLQNVARHIKKNLQWLNVSLLAWSTPFYFKLAQVANRTWHVFSVGTDNIECTVSHFGSNVCFLCKVGEEYKPIFCFHLLYESFSKTDIVAIIGDTPNPSGHSPGLAAVGVPAWAGLWTSLSPQVPSHLSHCVIL